MAGMEIETWESLVFLWRRATQQSEGRIGKECVGVKIKTRKQRLKANLCEEKETEVSRS